MGTRSATSRSRKKPVARSSLPAAVLFLLLLFLSAVLLVGYFTDRHFERSAPESYTQDPGRALREAGACSPIGGMKSAHELAGYGAQRCASARQAVRDLFGEETEYSVTYYLNHYISIFDTLEKCRNTPGYPKLTSRECTNAQRAQDIFEKYRVKP